ncbi:putative DNA binding protein [Corchorus capsularis]|uniref:Putative DNA binding protein n=1 Tax=Corchorus capsularis TaxID=210143 RepID=A0A1R3GS94_COCAP|nr:putative DNA binding protein [Corchorus capsularis]
MIVEEVETVPEIVENVATVAEKVSAQVAENLPDDSKLKKAAMVVEHVSEIMLADLRWRWCYHAHCYVERDVPTDVYRSLDVVWDSEGGGSSRRPLGPFASGITLPSYWEDAERWICSPVLGYGVSKNANYQFQCVPTDVYRSLDSVWDSEGGGSSRRHISASSLAPFASGITLPSNLEDAERGSHAGRDGDQPFLLQNDGDVPQSGIISGWPDLRNCEPRFQKAKLLELCILKLKHSYTHGTSEAASGFPANLESSKVEDNVRLMKVELRQISHKQFPLQYVRRLHQTDTIPALPMLVAVRFSCTIGRRVGAAKVDTKQESGRMKGSCVLSYSMKLTCVAQIRSSASAYSI